MPTRKAQAPLHSSSKKRTNKESLVVVDIPEADVSYH